jgi:hypothetical protein
VAGQAGLGDVVKEAGVNGDGGCEFLWKDHHPQAARLCDHKEEILRRNFALTIARKGVTWLQGGMNPQTESFPAAPGPQWES